MLKLDLAALRPWLQLHLEPMYVCISPLVCCLPGYLSRAAYLNIARFLAPLRRDQL